MIKLEKVDSSHPKWGEIWRVYEQSFPTKERRSARAHACAQTDSDFTTVAAFDSAGNFAALLFYWEYDNTVYVEHLAVNPGMMGPQCRFAVDVGFSGLGGRRVPW